MFKIENIGINGDSVYVVDSILSGSGDIYSVGKEECVDPISFKYNLKTREFTAIKADRMFLKKVDQIKDILKENLETNFVHRFRRF